MYTISMFPKDSKEYELLSKLDTPEKIQSYLEKIPFNLEKKGDTCKSASMVLRDNTAHCIEGACLACTCRMLQGRKPHIVSLKVKQPDDDHILIIFSQNGYYGALRKTNHPVLRYRDPIYRSIRELVMSYFHEYFLYTNGEKTLLGYSKPINLKRYGTKWITAEDDVWNIAEKIFDAPIVSIVPPQNKKYLRNATAFEQKILRIQEWK